MVACITHLGTIASYAPPLQACYSEWVFGPP